MIEKNRILEILDKFKNKKILVIGDMMIDEYLIGSVTRISPEAPVPVLNVEKERFVLGGAANVVNNLASLNVDVIPFGLIGVDQNGDKLINKFIESNINVEGIFKSNERPTIIKQRLLANNQQLLRLDWEKKHPIGKEMEDKIIDRFEEICLEIDAIILSDYDKGLLTNRLVRRVIEIAKDKDIIITVDPKPGNAINYKGATCMTPNLKESAETVLEQIPETEEDTIKIGKKIVEDLDLDHLLMTRSEKGMSIFNKNGEIENIPTFAKEVYDVTGAGDTVISVYTLALSCGATHAEAAKIANTAAGIVVGRVGTSVVTQNEIIEFYDEIYHEGIGVNNV